MLAADLDELLIPGSFEDDAPNGLQSTIVI